MMFANPRRQVFSRLGPYGLHNVLLPRWAHSNRLILKWKRELFVFLVSRDYCVALPHDVTGLSAVCDDAFS